MISCLYDECLWSVCHLISKEHFPIMGWWAVLLFHDPKERCRIYFSDGASQDSCKSKSNPKDDGWMDGWIDGWIDGRMNDLVNISLYIPIPINTSTTQNQNQARYTGHRRETFLSAHNSILSQMWLVDRHFPLGRNWHVLQIESRKRLCLHHHSFSFFPFTVGWPRKGRQVGIRDRIVRFLRHVCLSVVFLSECFLNGPCIVY